MQIDDSIYSFAPNTCDRANTLSDKSSLAARFRQLASSCVQSVVQASMTQTNPFHMEALMRSGSTYAVPTLHAQPHQISIPYRARTQWPSWSAQLSVTRRSQRSRRSHMIRDILGDSVLTSDEHSCSKETPEATSRSYGYLHHSSSSPAVVKPTPINPQRLGTPVSTAAALAYRLVASGAPPPCSYNILTPPWLRTDETLHKGEHLFALEREQPRFVKEVDLLD